MSREARLEKFPIQSKHGKISLRCTSRTTLGAEVALLQGGHTF